jgi:hypothetical protein
MYLGIYDIDDYLPIPVETHRFSSGAAYAPTVLTYSIYEEGGTTGIDEDVDMTPASPFDGVVGFYYARRQLTAAAGFERGKTYVVLIKATVDSVSAIVSYVFQIRATAVTLAAGQSIAVSDKTGFSLSSAGLLAIWNVLTSTMITAGSIGAKLAKVVKRNIN